MANPLHNMKSPHSSATKKVTKKFQVFMARVSSQSTCSELYRTNKKSTIYYVRLLSYKPQVNDS